jgi:hypothetical protein
VQRSTVTLLSNHTPPQTLPYRPPPSVPSCRHRNYLPLFSTHAIAPPPPPPPSPQHRAFVNIIARAFFAHLRTQAAVVKSFDEGTKPGRECVHLLLFSSRPLMSHQVWMRHRCRRPQGTPQSVQDNEHQEGELSAIAFPALSHRSFRAPMVTLHLLIYFPFRSKSAAR